MSSLTGATLPRLLYLTFTEQLPPALVAVTVAVRVTGEPEPMPSQRTRKLAVGVFKPELVIRRWAESVVKLVTLAPLGFGVPKMKALQTPPGQSASTAHGVVSALL